MEISIWSCVEPIIGFAAFVALGALLRGTKILKPVDAHVLNKVITNVALPAFIFSAIYGSEFTVDALKAVGVGWMLFPLMLGLGLLVCRAFKLSKRMTGTVLLCVAWANTGYIGYPLTAAIFGTDYMMESVFYDLFNTVATLIIIGVPLSAYFGTSEGTRAHPLKELLRMPAFYALAAGLVLKLVALPTPVVEWVQVLGNLCSPLIMISVGLSLNMSKLKGNGALIAVVTAIKLLVAPVVALGLASLLIDGTVARQVLVLEAGTPVMMLALVIAQRFDLDDEFIAAMVFVSVVACAVTIPALQLLLF
ncbi:MAG: AEC family transporter [Actinobacteria bacterium]|nr:AEC family transporter [Actinomycetota bacterium]